MKTTTVIVACLWGGACLAMLATVIATRVRPKEVQMCAQQHANMKSILGYTLFEPLNPNTVIRKMTDKELSKRQIEAGLNHYEVQCLEAYMGVNFDRCIVKCDANNIIQHIEGKKLEGISLIDFQRLIKIMTQVFGSPGRLAKCKAQWDSQSKLIVVHMEEYASAFNKRPNLTGIDIVCCVGEKCCPKMPSLPDF